MRLTHAFTDPLDHHNFDVEDDEHRTAHAKKYSDERQVNGSTSTSTLPLANNHEHIDDASYYCNFRQQAL